jgi:uncharacterized protein (TIGR02996 family)
MATEEAFIAAVVASPEDDTHRLVFADWLEENGQPARAELIRLQCRLEPDRDRFDDAALTPLHKRVDRLLHYSEPGHTAFKDRELRWFETVSGLSYAEAALAPEWRRGFVETVGVHAGNFVRHGRAIRRRYPLLRKVVVFALNGWGERLAACEWLDGIRKLELACWYSDDDARAVAGSPHLRSVERLVCWSGGGLGQAETLARGAAWPALREIHLVSAFGQHGGWVEAVDAAAGRPVGSVYVFDEELFPFAHDFYEGYCGYEGIFAGKLPDGTQLIVREWSFDGRAMLFDGHAFDPDGTPRPEPFRLPIPPELWWQSGRSGDEEERDLTRARKEFLRRAVGFEPALVRVRGIDSDWLGWADRFCGGVRDAWGVPDAPGSDPVADRDVRQGGNGAEAYHWVRTGMFQFHHRESEDTFTRAGRSTGDAFVPW